MDFCFQKSAFTVVTNIQIYISLYYTSWVPLGGIPNLAKLYSQIEVKLILLRTKVAEINHLLKSLFLKYGL